MLKKTNIILFIMGFGIFMFTRRSEFVPTLPIAIVIAPILILRFIRVQPLNRGLIYTFMGFLISMNIALWGLFETSDHTVMAILSLIRSSLLSVLYFLPFMIDRWLYPRFKEYKILATLTYPIISTAIFFLSSLEGPFDGAGMSSKFVFGPSFLMQSVSIFGIWIFIFMYSWLAALINYSWEEGFKWHVIKGQIFSFTLLVIIWISSSVARITFNIEHDKETVKIAAIVLLPENGKAVTMEQIFNNRQVSPYTKTISRIDKLAGTAAANGAKIVSFQEFSILIYKEIEKEMIETFKRIARENVIYLSITYAYFVKDGKGENKHLLIDEQGNLQLAYSKRYLMGFGSFGETAVFNKGAEIIQSLQTPYGRIGIVICRDMDFLSYIRQAANQNVDIMLGPSYDWPKSTGPDYWLRAIENGFSFVRPTYNGISFAEDYYGSVLNSMDYDKTKDGIMYANVPTQGVKTIYSVIGDLLGWLSVTMMLLLIVFKFLE